MEIEELKEDLDIELKVNDYRGTNRAEKIKLQAELNLAGEVISESKEVGIKALLAAAGK